MLDRSKSAWNNYERHHGPNMTPMVDVVMVILIFFMASTTMLGPEWLLRSGVAQADSGVRIYSDRPQRRFECTLERAQDGSTRVILPGRELDLETFRTEILAAAEEVGPTEVIVVLNPRASVNYSDVVTVHEWCAKAGVTKIGLGRAR